MALRCIPKYPYGTASAGTHGRIAYVAQQAAIFNASVRDNILFGRELESKRYAEVLAASGLAQGRGRSEPPKWMATVTLDEGNAYWENDELVFGDTVQRIL